MSIRLHLAYQSYQVGVIVAVTVWLAVATVCLNTAVLIHLLSQNTTLFDQDPGHVDPLGSSEAAAAAVGSSMDSAEQSLEDQGEEYDEEMDEGMDPDDEDEEELAMQQPAVHDVHVSTEAAEPAGTSGPDRAAAAAR